MALAKACHLQDDRNETAPTDHGKDGERGGWDESRALEARVSVKPVE